MCGDGSIHFAGQLQGPLNCRHDPLVFAPFGVTNPPLAAVFQPFAAYLMGSNFELPNIGRHRPVGPIAADHDIWVLIFWMTRGDRYLWLAFDARVAGQVTLDKLSAELAETPKQWTIGGQKDPRKIGQQRVGVALAVSC